MKTEFKEGEKFILEIGKKHGPLDEYEIVGTDLYFRADLLRRLIPYLIPCINDLISRKWLIECVDEGWIKFDTVKDKNKFIHLVRDTAPSAQQVYTPVKAEDFAKTMSENMPYSFMAWYGEALALMERYGFVICKKFYNPHSQKPMEENKDDQG